MKKASLWHDGQHDIVRFDNWLKKNKIKKMVKTTNSMYSRYILKLEFNDEKAYLLFLMCFKKTIGTYSPNRYVYPEVDQ